jgi:hypothetical protein
VCEVAADGGLLVGPGKTAVMAGPDWRRSPCGLFHEPDGTLRDIDAATGWLVPVRLATRVVPAAALPVLRRHRLRKH